MKVNIIIVSDTHTNIESKMKIFRLEYTELKPDDVKTMKNSKVYSKNKLKLLFMSRCYHFASE